MSLQLGIKWIIYALEVSWLIQRDTGREMGGAWVHKQYHIDLRMVDFFPLQ